MHSDLIDFIVVNEACRFTNKKTNVEVSKNCYAEINSQIVALCAELNTTDLTRMDINIKKKVENQKNEKKK